MIEIFTYIILPFLPLQSGGKVPSAPIEQVVLECKLQSCERIDSLFLFEFNGVNFTKVMSAPTTDWQNYQFKIPLERPRFYYVGTAPNNLKPIILGFEKKVSLRGSCAQMQMASLPDSDLNKQYELLKQTLSEHKNRLTNYLRQYQLANGQDNVEMANEAILGMRDLDKERKHLIDSLQKVQPFLAKIAALNTYLSYHNNGTADESELEYFATKTFQLVDWNDPDLEYNPWVYETIRDYAQTLASINLPVNNQKHYLDLQLSAIPQSRRTYMLALGGVIAGLQNAKSTLFIDYAKRYIQLYKDRYPDAAAQLESIVKSTQSFLPGAEAPDFTMETPDGKMLSLKDLRGKVVLIDFWASWCGPCRRENPNVVKAYQKYHPKGFDVLGVSLDKDRKRWLDAIEKDGLIWHHVSDLKGWSNAAAQLYGVSSIPHTVLVDRDGKIIARNLRGPALEQKLEEIFGE